MAAVMTYDSLSSEIAGWFERESDAALVSNIPSIIADAESMLGRELKPLGFETAYSGTFIPGQPWFLKPALWRGTVSMTVLTGAPTYGASGPGLSGPPYTNAQSMLPRSVEYCRRMWPQPDTSDINFPPRYYADWEWGRWYVAPTPAVAFPFEVIVYARPVPLDAASQTNWLTENAPDILRSYCMARGAQYLKNLEASADWMASASRGNNGLTAEDARRIVDRSTSPEKSP